MRTSSNTMPADVRASHRDGERVVLGGSVEPYYRSWQRTRAVDLPRGTSVRFDLGRANRVNGEEGRQRGCGESGSHNGRSVNHPS
jgi:hypothetical protein